MMCLLSLFADTVIKAASSEAAKSTETYRYEHRG